MECSDYTPIRIKLFGNLQSMQDLLANIHCYVIFKYVHECDIYRKKNWSFKSSSVHMNIFPFIYYPVRIRVRIDPPHPLVCRKRRLNGAVIRMRPQKPRSRVTTGVTRQRSLPAQRPWAPSVSLNFLALHRQCRRILIHVSEKFLSGVVKPSINIYIFYLFVYF